MEIKRVFDLLDHYVEKYPNQDAALAGKKNGQWVKYSSRSYQEHANFLSYALIELGIEKGDKVAMILTNRPEWNMLDMAISQVGAINDAVSTWSLTSGFHVTGEGSAVELSGVAYEGDVSLASGSVLDMSASAVTIVVTTNIQLAAGAVLKVCVTPDGCLFVVADIHRST